MKKQVLFNMAIALGVLGGALVWLLGEVGVFGDFDNGFKAYVWVALAIASGIPAIMLLCRGLVGKSRVEMKQFFVVFGACLAVLSVFSIISAFNIEQKLVMPIVAVVLSAVLVIFILSKGTKRWDKGDNQSPDYKNYRQRKAEQEQLEQAKKEKVEQETIFKD